MKIFQIATILFILTHASTGLHSQPWKQYSDSAKFYNDKENKEKAIEFYSKAKEELKKDSARTNSYAGICNSLADLYTDINKYDTAELLYLEAKQIRQKVFGKENADYATSCNDLAYLYDEIGEYNKAETLYLEAKEIRETVLGKENADYATSCNNLGSLYWKAGEYKKAETFYLEAKQIREKTLGKENAEYAGSCSGLANLYSDMGEYKKAETLYLEAKQIREKVLGKETREYAGSCENLAILYNDIGQYEKAEALYLEAKQIREKVLGKEHRTYAESCANLAVLYYDMGQYNKAETFDLEAKQILEKVLGKDHPDYAKSCINLANLYMQIGQHKKALPLYLKAKQVFEKVPGKESFLYAINCENLANLYRDLAQNETAEPLYLEAKRILKKMFGSNNPFYAFDCNDLAISYMQTGKYKKAEALYLEAKQVREKVCGKEHPDYIESCIGLANLYRLQAKFDKANDLYAEALRLQNVQVKKIFQFTSEAEKQSYLNKIANLENYFLSFNTKAYSHSNEGFTYDVSLSSRNLILSSSQQLRKAIYNTTDTSIKNKYDTWINIRKQLAFWYAKPLADRPGYVKDLEEQANALEKELTRSSSEFQKQQAENNITWQTIQQNLKPNEAAIEFVKFHFYNGKRWTDSSYYIALVLTRNDPTPQLIPLFEEKQLNYLIKAGNTYSTIAALYKNEKANAAYNLIWAPVEKHLKGITKIYFAPSGLFYRISLPALQANDHKVLSDKYQLIQLNTTASVVNQAENFIDTSDKVYLYGGIQYDVDSATLRQAVAGYHIKSVNKSFIPTYATRGNELTYLPYTEKEINEIENLNAQKSYSVAVFSGTSASEESIKALNGNASPSVLHIATHGFFFPDPKEKKKNSMQYETGSGDVFQQSDNPLFRSGLLLSGANAAWKGKPVEGVEDGVLTAYEVSNLYLPNTKLVVLSACETGLGDIQGNEGVYGLQRAFKIAGVQNLVMSLWKVPDKETSQFMQEFYKNIFDKQSISDAFYNAQTVMKNKYRSEPYKWAAWILVR